MIHVRFPLTALACLVFLVAAPRASEAACDQTLAAGANIATAVAAAANGSTICLASGNYTGAGVQFSGINRTGFVTVRSATGVGATLTSPVVFNSKFIKFDSLTLTNMAVSACSTNIQILGSTFLPQTQHLLFNYDTACAGVTDMALVVDGNSFDRGQQILFEGRISVRGVNGLTISNNSITNVPTTAPSDGIQLVGNAQNVTIGPGNVFSGIIESLCGPVHCDAIQLYGAGPNVVITGNWFNNGDTFIMAPDGSDSVTISNNVFDGSSNPYNAKLQMGTAANGIIRHNTIVRTNAGFTSKTGSPASTNGLVENNILINGTIDFSFGSGCTGCTARFNQFANSAEAFGTNTVIAAPAFTGGASPTTWTGWQLTATSPGHNAGNDGKDLGANYFGPGTGTQPPAPPTSVRIIR